MSYGAACAAKIAAERVSDPGSVLTWAVEQGHTLAMATLTLQHHAEQSLSDSWDALTAARSGRVTSGVGWASEQDARYFERLSKWESDRASGWKCSRRRERPAHRVRLAEQFGMLGWARAVEVSMAGTAGPPHPRHPDPGRTGVRGTSPAVGRGDVRHWQRGLAAHGLTAIRDAGGLDIRRAYNEDDLAAYVANQVATEATHGHAKTGCGGSQLRAPFQLFADLVATGDTAGLAVWREWERASKGRRQLTWSDGVRPMAGLGKRPAP